MSKEIKIGILTIVGLGLLIWGYNFLKGENIFKSQTTYYVKYDNIQNLEVSSPVYINGYQVGNVQTIEIDPANLQNIIVGLEVDPKVKLPQNTVAQLYSDGVMGDMAIRLEYTGVCDADCITNGSFLKAEKLSFINSFFRPNELDEYMIALKQGVGGVLDTVNNLMSSEEYKDSELGKVTMNIKNTISNLESATNHLNTMIMMNSKAMNQMISNLNEITGGIATNQESLNKTIQNIESITSQVAGSALDSTISSTNKTIANLGETSEQITLSLSRFDQTTEKLNSILDNIKEGNGTMGRLIKNDSLYSELNSTMRNLDLLLQDFRLNPKRYVNVSVFGKKQKEYTLPEDDPASQQGSSDRN
ncbi:MlaD family protein [Membranihabitans maritimus]|uniref:MlaD family protein n=1 Tax=Membranihabitans maritimus TaxID=2904244 RepID=UPI001F3A7E75|nr:MlaD family protein [Membranihabitans maritimus]